MIYFIYGYKYLNVLVWYRLLFLKCQIYFGDQPKPSSLFTFSDQNERKRISNFQGYRDKMMQSCLFFLRGWPRVCMINSAAKSTNFCSTILSFFLFLLKGERKEARSITLSFHLRITPRNIIRANKCLFTFTNSSF